MRWIATSFPVILALLIFQGSGFAEQMQIESVTTELVFLKDGEKLLVVKPDIGQLPKDVAVLGAELIHSTVTALATGSPLGDQTGHSTLLLWPVWSPRCRRSWPGCCWAGRFR